MKIIKAPIYYQLSMVLRELITKNKYQAGSKFLTEREIAKKYEVSRTTANKVISGLVSEGLLEIKKGVGTFVSTLRLNTNLHNLVSFTAKAKALNCIPQTKVLYLKKINITTICNQIPDIIQEAGNLNCFLIKRLRIASDIPVILEKRYLFLPKNINLTKQILSGSLYNLLEDKLGININKAEQTISARNLNKEEAELLKVKTGDAVLEIFSKVYTNNDILLWQETTLYRSDKYVFINNIDNKHNSLSKGTLVGLPEIK